MILRRGECDTKDKRVILRRGQKSDTEERTV